MFITTARGPRYMTLYLFSPTRFASTFLGAAALLAAGLFTAGNARAQSVCDSFYGANFSLTQGKVNPSIISMSKPAKGVAVSELNFKTCMVRGTSHAADTNTEFLRNDYSRRQAFNADNSYFLAYAPDGWWHLYDAKTLQHLRKLSPKVANPSVSSEFHMAGDAEPQWHPTDPNLLYYLPTNGGTKLLRLDVRNNSFKIAADFEGKLPSWANNAQHIWTKSEGSPSADGRYWGFQVEDGNFNLLGYMVWDLQQNKLVGSRKDNDRPDHSSMSASGRWFVTSSDSSGTWAWSPDFTKKKKLHSKSEHSDLALGPNGEDLYVSVDYQSNEGDVFMTNMDSCPAVPASATSAPICPRTVLFTTYINGAATAMHFSGKAFSRPGWLLWSTYGTSKSRDGTWPWYTDKIMAVELKANPRIYPIAYHRSNVGDYFAEPHATVSRDFTRIAFNSNWDSSQVLDLDVYLVRLPASALPGGIATPPSRTPSTGGNLPPVLGGGGSAAAAASNPLTTTPVLVKPGGAVIDGSSVRIRCVLCAGSERAASAWRAMSTTLAWLRSAWTTTGLWGSSRSTPGETPAADARSVASGHAAQNALPVGTRARLQATHQR